MLLSTLYELQRSGALRVDINDKGIVSVGGMNLTNEMMENLLANFGWKYHYLNAVEIVTKTEKFVKSFAKWMPDNVLCHIDVSFENRRADAPDKSYDRIWVDIRTSRIPVQMCIVYGMKGAPALYTTYISQSGNPIGKARNLKQVAEQITNYMGWKAV